MWLTRPPCPALAPFVESLWASDEPPCVGGAARERMLPGTGVRILLRFGEPLRVFDAADAKDARTIGDAIVGGPRTAAYVRDTSRPVQTVSARLRPGAAEILLGAPAEALADRHTLLDDLWGGGAGALRDRVGELRDPRARIDAFEAALAARVDPCRRVDPVIAFATERLAARWPVADVVRASGYSHRAFITLFRRAVGLTPKTFGRVARMNDALERLAKAPPARVALDAGYADQAHLTRELRDLCGVLPSQHRALAPRWPTHVPVVDS